MAYGAKFKNASGSVIIDGAYKNLGLRTRGSFTEANRSGQYSNGAYFINITIANGNPLMALAGVNASVSSVVKSGANTTFSIDYDAGTVEYFIFDEPAQCPKYATNYGMIIKSTINGEVVFDSRLPYMKIIDVFTGTVSNTGDAAFPTVSRSYPNASKVCVVQVRRWYYVVNQQISGGNPPSRLIVNFESCSSASGQQVTLSRMQQFSLPPSPNNPIPNQYNDDTYYYLVLDLTGLL